MVFMEYDLELDKVVEHIKKQKAKMICVQLPDGLKEKAREIQLDIEARTKAKVVVWFGSCYGACDTPKGLEKLGVDLLIQWGHSSWKF